MMIFSRRFSVFLFICSFTEPAVAQTSVTIWQIKTEDLVALRERPLFARTRRPPETRATEVVASAGVMGSGPLALVGVIRREGGQGLAVLQSASGEVLRLALGERYQEWELSELGPRRAVLRSTTKSLELTLADPAVIKPNDAELTTPRSQTDPHEGGPMYPAPLFKSP